MHRQLLIKAFEKAREDTGYTKRTPLSRYLSQIIFEKSKQQYGDKSLRTYYNSALENSKDRIEFSYFVVQSLCEYLECEDFKSFKEKNKVVYPPEKTESFLEISIQILKKQWILALLIMIIASTFIIIPIKKTKWMVWKEDHYVEVKFDTDKYKISQLKLYNEERVLYFKKITPDCDTDFFKPDGIENLWYEKNTGGELEFFTAIGSHPETGKTLKPITQYMIEKYICEIY